MLLNSKQTNAVPTLLPGQPRAVAALMGQAGASAPTTRDAEVAPSLCRGWMFPRIQVFVAFD